MLDLYNNKYDRQTLKNNIYAVKLIDLIKTQIIDEIFAIRYILNKKYQLDKDDYVTVDILLKYQPHITYNNLQKVFLEYDSDDDSVEDFETVSNRE